MRYLDAAAVAAALSPAQAVEAITSALRGGFDPADDIARAVVPVRHGQFLLMPSEVGAYAGVKIATVAPANPAAGRPRIQADYLLVDADTLSLQAIMDGTALTTLRTPAVSVAAVRPALDRLSGAARVVVLGAGPQALGHVDTLAAELAEPLADVAFVVRHPERVDGRARSLGRVATAGSPQADAALATADLVVCATTAREPLFPATGVPDDVIVIAVGSHEPAARELDAVLLGRATVIVEDRATALREAGDVILARDEGELDPAALVPMADLLTGQVRLPEHGPVVFKSVGMSWQDLVIAATVLVRTGD